jgi:hypothetical protein
MMWFIVLAMQLARVDQQRVDTSTSSSSSSSSSSSLIPEWLLPLLPTEADRTQYLKFVSMRLAEESEMRALMQSLRANASTAAP